MSALQTHAPLCCRAAGASRAEIRLLPRPFSQSSFCRKIFSGIRFAPPMARSSDYPKRRPRKSLLPKTKSETPKGFAPKPQVRSVIQKKDINVNDEQGQATLTYGEYTVQEAEDSESISSIGAVNSTGVSVEAEQERSSLDGRIDELPFTGDHSAVVAHQAMEEEKNIIQEEKMVVRSTDSSIVGNDQIDDMTLRAKDLDGREAKISINNDVGLREKEKDDEARLIKAKAKMEALKREKKLEDLKQKENEARVLKEKAEMEMQVQKKMLEDLAEDGLLNKNKMFVFPKVVKPDQTVDIFFNRSASALMDEPDVLVMGAFNDWRWKSFTHKLQRSELNGDWWSCQLHIPKEAYKVNLVFFNGEDIYENNESKDFFISVQGGMDIHAFEDFLLEEKRKELEKLAAEQAERERQAEEEKRKEAENAAREADKAHARIEAGKKREALRIVLNVALSSTDDVWQINPKTFRGGGKIRLFYNRNSRSLTHAQEIWIHGGYNNWKDGPSIVERLFPSEKEGGDWWYTDVSVPKRALVLSWVFADGPLQNAKVYDNNNNQDFHAIVPDSISEELYWVEEEHEIYNKLQEARKVHEESQRGKVEKTARMKKETKERAMKTFLLSQKHIFYTEPLDARAGSTVTVFYNPSNTVLNGKPEIWLRCSFNRWTHRSGPLPPQKMVPTHDGPIVKASVKIPLDAYMMDFVLSEKEDGGIYDNRSGMDYHIPVSGGISREPPMHIVHVAVEMAPIAKVGGLGDVVTSLSRAVQDLGHSVEIILPKYDCLNLNNVRDLQFHQSFAWGGTEVKVWFGKVEGLSVYFLEPQNGMFWKGCIYGCGNDGERFGFFCHAALEFLLQKGAHPDILHCHDWSSAPVAWLFKEHYRHYGLSNARVIFTIHNLEFGAGAIGRAMLNADKATTVSPNYSREVSGNGAVAPHLHKFHGIINGIDPDIWDPYNDNFIPLHYTSENVVEGKRAAKEALQQRLGLKRSDMPLLGIITRLTVQKGIHLIKHAIGRTLERNGQVVLLGSAPDPRIQNDFVNLANQLHSSHGDRVRLCLTYDEPLSHLIYAGSDFILVPSMFEPCGLTQLTAMRYGSIPVVRKTGGLYDTVFDVDNDKGRAAALGLEPNGFSFDGTDSGSVDYALNRALSAWFDGRDWFNSLCKRVMEQDWSWNRPALDYLELYHAARKN